MYDNNITERIKEYRTVRSHLTQKDLAEALDISLSVYRKLENNGEFSFEQLKNIADIFDIPFEDLLFGEPKKDLVPMVGRNKPKKPFRFHDLFDTMYEGGIPVPEHMLNDIKIILAKLSMQGRRELYQYAMFLYYRETKHQFK